MIRAFLAVVLTVLTIHVSPAWAQEPAVPNYQTWERVATQSEQLVGEADTPAAQLNDIRTRGGAGHQCRPDRHARKPDRFPGSRAG